MSYGGDQKNGYDGNIVVFSPDGRMYQVEYAREAVKRGSTIAGIKVDAGIVLVGDKRIGNDLVEADTIQKVFRIDANIYMATSGLMADGRALVDIARRMSQSNRVTYDEEIQVPVLADMIASHMQSVTHGGNRPYGVGLIVAGKSSGKFHMFELDPSGTRIGYKAVVVGEKREEACAILKIGYLPTLDIAQATGLLARALDQATDGKMDWDTADYVVIT